MGWEIFKIILNNRFAPSDLPSGSLYSFGTTLNKTHTQLHSLFHLVFIYLLRLIFFYMFTHSSTPYSFICWFLYLRIRNDNSQSVEKGFGKRWTPDETLKTLACHLSVLARTTPLRPHAFYYWILARVGIASQKGKRSWKCYMWARKRQSSQASRMLKWHVDQWALQPCSIVIVDKLHIFLFNDVIKPLEYQFLKKYFPDGHCRCENEVEQELESA